MNDDKRPMPEVKVGQVWKRKTTRTTYVVMGFMDYGPINGLIVLRKIDTGRQHYLTERELRARFDLIEDAPDV